MSEQQQDDIPLSFDEWADLSARMLKLDPQAREDLLEEYELRDAWGRCDLHYGTLIATDLRAGRMDRAQAYAARFTSDKIEVRR
jgi:hypothetical protein